MASGFGLDGRQPAAVQVGAQPATRGGGRNPTDTGVHQAVSCGLRIARSPARDGIPRVPHVEKLECLRETVDLAGRTAIMSAKFPGGASVSFAATDRTRQWIGRTTPLRLFRMTLPDIMLSAGRRDTCNRVEGGRDASEPPKVRAQQSNTGSRIPRVERWIGLSALLVFAVRSRHKMRRKGER